MTLYYQNRILSIARQRSGNPGVRKPGPGGPQGPAGPSNLAPGMQLSGQRQPGQPPQQAPGQQQQQRVVKRNSTSPGEVVHFLSCFMFADLMTPCQQHGQLPNSENSPPDRKRVRRSSVSMDQGPPVGYPHQPQQQAQQQMMNGGMMRPGPGPMPGGPMNNFPPHGPPGMANMGIPMGAPQVPGSAMSPGMGGPRAPNMMGVSPSRVFSLSVLRIAPYSHNCSITRAFTQSQRALLCKTFLGVVRERLRLAIHLSTRGQDNLRSQVHKTTAWDKTSPWG